MKLEHYRCDYCDSELSKDEMLIQVYHIPTITIFREGTPISIEARTKQDEYHFCSLVHFKEYLAKCFFEATKQDGDSLRKESP